ncbi:MAG: GNAT family N-acetyltransferase [Caldilineaceae bacterium]|nr:GNAT family N-acetyltransferase [Caldilineaceae bacterium]
MFSVHMRGYAGEEDYWRIRAFLRDLFLLNNRREICWHVVRWDYWRWPGVESWGDGPLDGRVFIWKDEDGRIAAVLNPEGHGQAFLQVHPGRHTPSLATDMLAVAEEALAVVDGQGRRRLTVWADAGDTLLQALLARRGYAVSAGTEHRHRRDLTRPVETAALPDGFTVRPLGDVDELPARAWYSWKAFNPATPEEEYAKLGWEWYLDIQRCPLYRRDLDLVVVAPNGELASFCGVWFDDTTRSAVIEPVGTYGPYQRRGLARAVILEGMRRVQRLGATVIFVSGHSAAANTLYRAVTDEEDGQTIPWTRQLN